MKSKSLLVNILVLLLISLSLAACGPVVSAETELLVDADYKYSVRYPDDFNIETYGTGGVAILKGTREDYKGARADINLLPTGSLNTQGAAEEYVSTYPDAELIRSTILLDGEEAEVIDGVPGKELNRVVLIVHGDKLFKLNFVPADSKDGDYRQMEALYKVIVESFDFDPQP